MEASTVMESIQTKSKVGNETIQPYVENTDEGMVCN